MSDQVNTTANYTFANNVELQLQQTKSQLLGTVEEQGETGEKVTVKDLVGNTMPQEADERHGDLKQTQVGHDRVWLAKPNELYFLEYVDGADELATKIDIAGGYTMAGAATINRAWDDRILEGAYGPIVSGKDGTISTPFPAGQIIPVTTGGASGAQRMNVAKLIAAGEMLDAAYVPPGEERYMVISTKQNSDLLAEVPATSSDFRGAYGGEFRDGRILRLLGWNFIHLELRNPMLRVMGKGLTVDGNGYTRNPFWTKSGIRINFWQRLRTAIKDQPQKVNTRSVFAGTTAAATRTQAGKVGIILNSEA
ncbi:MAG: phage capsid protein [Sphingomonas sp.]|nr:phage capsid protein [Sphingomonas sp.]MDX3883602.1 phage capsid protein [Sphingomonas sp.]